MLILFSSVINCAKRDVCNVLAALKIDLFCIKIKILAASGIILLPLVFEMMIFVYFCFIYISICIYLLNFFFFVCFIISFFIVPSIDAIDNKYLIIIQIQFINKTN